MRTFILIAAALISRTILFVHGIPSLDNLPRITPTILILLVIAIIWDYTDSASKWRKNV